MNSIQSTPHVRLRPARATRASGGLQREPRRSGVLTACELRREIMAVLG